MKKSIFAKTPDGKIIAKAVSEKFFNNTNHLPNETRLERISSYTKAIEQNLAKRGGTNDRDRVVHEKLFANTKCLNCADKRFLDVPIFSDFYQQDVVCSFACTCNEKPPKISATGDKQEYTKVIELLSAGVYKLHCQLSADCCFDEAEKTRNCGNTSCPRYDNALAEYNKNAIDLKAWGLVRA